MALEFFISSPGLLHLSTILLSFACVALGFMTHMHAEWVRKDEYRLCQHTPEKLWQAASYVSSKKIECPNISLETAFILISVLCMISSMALYSLHLCCCKGVTSTLIKVLYIFLCGLLLIVAGILYIRSAVMIANLPEHDILPLLTNIWRVLLASFKGDYSDGLKLQAQPHHESFYHEKLVTGSLTIINGILHILTSWLTILDCRHSRASDSKLLGLF